MDTTPLRVLIDTSVDSDTHVLRWALDRRTVKWGGKPVTAHVAVMVRKPPRDKQNEQHIRALPTIARLARERVLQLVTYSELTFEGMYGRRSSTTTIGDLFVSVDIGHIEPAVDRSFFESIMFPDTGETDQLRRFCEQLLARDFPWSEIIANSAHDLPPRTVESLNDVESFRKICRHAPSKHYPDLFHLWTGEVNGCAYFLTMEKRLTNFYESHLGGAVACRPIQPADLVEALGIIDLDPMPGGDGGKVTFTDAVNIFRTHD